MGMLTPTNSPLRRAGPVEGTTFANNIPIAIARIIQITKNLSRSERPWRGGTWLISMCLVVSIEAGISIANAEVSGSIYIPGGDPEPFSMSDGIPVASLFLWL